MTAWRPGVLPEGAHLPTFDRLGVSPLQEIDANQIAQEWVASLSKSVDAHDVEGILSNFYEFPWWRDIFALTWDLRTFYGYEKIATFLKDRLELSKFGNLKFLDATYDRPFEDIAWIVTQFDFETDVASGRGIARLVFTKDGWKAVTIATNLEGLKGFPEKLGSLRNYEPSHGKWVEQRRREQAFEGSEPEVLIIGGGQSGLDVAARLKMLGTSHLIIEKNTRIGDIWRNRYEALCLHDPVCKSPNHAIAILPLMNVPRRVRPHALSTVCVFSPLSIIAN